jgi:uncharacterized 2Fe-2S/4Fe-4S cluster protein (DUF4445 family)
MPRTQGATAWSIHEVKEVAQALHHKNRVATSDRDVLQLSKKLGRPPRSIQRVFHAVKTGKHKLFETPAGRRELRKYIVEGPMNQYRSLSDRVKEAIETYRSAEKMIPQSQVDKMLKDNVKQYNLMVRAAYAWGYNNAVADAMQLGVDAPRGLTLDVADEIKSILSNG